MSTDISSKLNRLLSSQPLGVVLCSSWLVENGYSLNLQQRYKKSQWFDSIGAGALIRYGDHVDYLGGVYAMQTQLGLSLHPGGRAALGLQGKAHYLELSPKHVQLFGAHGEHVPLWFKKQDWSVNVKYTLSNFLPAEIGLTEIPHKQFTVKVSEPARAIMECLYLAPKSQSLLEAYELMEGLNNLRPASVQKLLEACNSIKVKRLFLYLAEKAKHDWMKYLDLGRVNLGSGKRAIAASGVYIPKYQITVPKELESME